MGICLPCMDFAMWQAHSLLSSCLRHPSLPWTILWTPLFPEHISSLLTHFSAFSYGTYSANPLGVFLDYLLWWKCYSAISLRQDKPRTLRLYHLFQKSEPLVLFVFVLFCLLLFFKIKTLPLLIWYSVKGLHLYLCITQIGFCRYIDNIKILNYISVLNTY